VTIALQSKPDSKRKERRQQAMKHIDVPLTINEWLQMQGAGSYSRKRDLPILIPGVGGDCLTDPQDLFEADTKAAFWVNNRNITDLSRREAECIAQEAHWTYSPRTHAGIVHCIAAEKYITIWYRRVLGARANAIKRSAAE
jgi:hypothetical protein